MTTRLTNLRLDRVAVVDRGADQDANIVLFKRHEEDNDSLADSTKLSGGDKNVSKEDEDMPDLNLDALPESLRALFGGDPSQDGVDALVAGLATAAEKVPEGAATELVEANKRLEAAEVALQKNKDDDDDDDTVLKGLTPEAMDIVRKAREETADLRKTVESEVEKRQTLEHVEFAKSLGDVPGAEAGVVGGILYRVEKNLPEEDFEKIKEILTSAANIVKANSLLKSELGQTSSEPLVDGDEKIQSIAKGIQAKSATPMTIEAATDLALQTTEGASAYSDREAEVRKRITD